MSCRPYALEPIGNYTRVVVDDALTNDYAAHTTDATKESVELTNSNSISAPLREAFPDLSVTIDYDEDTEDAIVDRYMMHGTNEGDCQGISPTSTEIEFTGIVIHYVENGKVRKDVSELDTLNVMQPLGVVESPVSNLL